LDFPASEAAIFGDIPWLVVKFEKHGTSGSQWSHPTQV
jgi:hypothetical protein